MNKVTNVRVLSNLVRLGVKNRTRAYSGLRRWRRMQSISQQVLQARSIDDLPWTDAAQLTSNCGDRIFMSFHYGLWGLCIRAVVKATQCRRVYCIVDQAESAYSARLAALGQVAGIDLVVLSGGRSLLLGMAQARAEGAPIFAMLDGPCATSDETSQRFAFMGGQIAASATLFSLAVHAGLVPHLLVADYDERQHTSVVRSHAPKTQADCFALLEAYVKDKPWLWERLGDLHQQVSMPGRQPHLPFKLFNDFYVANMADLKVSRVNQTLYEQVLQVKRFTLQGLPLHAVSLLTDIRASTNLQLGAVF